VYDLYVARLASLERKRVEGRLAELAKKYPDLVTNKIDYKNAHLRATLVGHTDAVRSVAFSPDGKTLASGSVDNTVKFWDVASDTKKPILAKQGGNVVSVAFTPDGTTLASGSMDATVILWDAVSGREKSKWHNGGWVWAMACSPEGKTLAASSKSMIKLWDLGLGREILTLRGHTANVRSVAFSPDGMTLASGSADNTVKFWSVDSGKLKATLIGHTSIVLSVAFSPDGRTLASAGGHDNTVRLWEAASGRLLATLARHGGGVNSVAYSPDGEILAAASGDGLIRLWEIGSSKIVATLAGHGKHVYAVAFSPSGRLLASGSGDNTVKFWEFATVSRTARNTRRSKVHPKEQWISKNATYKVSSIHENFRPLPSLLNESQQYYREETDFAFHTRNESGAWVTIDLGKPKRITRVFVLNRNGAQDRAIGMSLYISSDGKRQQKVWTATQGLPEWNVQLKKPIVGRYVTLKHPDNVAGILHLKKVKVFGSESTSSRR